MSDTQKSSQERAVKWIYSAQEAIDKCNELERENAEARAEIEHKDKLIEQMREALRLAVEWIEDDRCDDEYITEEWYHKSKTALAAERGEWI